MRTVAKDSIEDRPLSIMEQMFVAAYDGNATNAAIAAGYSAKTADVQGVRLLARVRVQEAIARRGVLEARTNALIMSRQQRQELWSRIANGEAEPGQPPPSMDNRLRASELLGKSEGDFIERRQYEGGLGHELLDAALQQLASGVPPLLAAILVKHEGDSNGE